MANCVLGNQSSLWVIMVNLVAMAEATPTPMPESTTEKVYDTEVGIQNSKHFSFPNHLFAKRVNYAQKIC